MQSSQSMARLSLSQTNLATSLGACSCKLFWPFINASNSYPLHPPPADSAAAPESDGSKLTALHVSEGAAPVEDSSTNPALETVEPEPSAEPSKKKRKSKKQKRHENPPTPRNSLASHVPTSNGTLVLGHTSLLTSFLLTPDGKYIVTADRDEHIRVSWFPQGFCIESFCLGHTQWVESSA